MSTLPSSRKAEFTSSLIIIDDFGLPYELAFPLVYYSAVLSREIIVPTGFKTDLASVPLGLWNILPRSGRYDRAAVIHDYLYQHNGCTREEADSVLNEAMKVLAVNGLKLRLIYAGVKVGGWKSWGKYRKAGERESQNQLDSSERVDRTGSGSSGPR